MRSLDKLDRSNSVEIDLGGDEFKADARCHLAEWATRPPFYVLNNGPVAIAMVRISKPRTRFTISTNRLAS